MRGEELSKESLSSAVPAVPAATTILVREGEGGPEVFLMRRHSRSSLPEMHVFPGGRMESNDRLPELLAGNEDFSAEKAWERVAEPALSPAEALAFYFCALRELFEEAGILLARSPGGEELDFTRPETARHFLQHRRRLQEGESSLLNLKREEKLVFSPEKLIPYAHWITPEFEKKRFDARFFLVRLPPGQSAGHDEIELADSGWFRPAEALEEQRRGRLRLMPPTLKTLEELTPFSSLAELFAAAEKRRILPMLPQGFKSETGFGVLLPYDPEYTLPGYKQPPRPWETSRLLLENGRWRLVRPRAE